MKLFKILLKPLIKRFFITFLGIILASSLSFGLFYGFRSSYYTIREEVDNYISEYGFPDYYVLTEDIKLSDASSLSTYKKLFHIDNIIFRKTLEVNFYANGNRYGGKIYSYESSDFIKQRTIYIDESVDSGLKVEKTFAEKNNINVGDTLTFKINENDLELKVNEIVSSPETGVLAKKVYSISTTMSYAYLYLEKSQLLTLFDIPDTFNEVLVDFTNETYDTDVSQVMKILENRGLSDKIIIAYDKDNSRQMIQYNSVISSLNTISILVPLGIFIITLLIVLVLLNQLINQFRKDIGIIKSLGYSSTNIIFVFLMLILILSLFVLVIGSIIGFIIALIANKEYEIALRMYKIPYTIYFGLIFEIYFIFTIVLLLFMTIILLRISMIKPNEIIKSLRPYSSKVPFLTRTVFKNANNTLKFYISQTLRNKRRIFLSIICIIASTVMINLSLNIVKSKEILINQLFETRLNYDFEVEGDTSTIINDYLSKDDNVLDYEIIKTSFVPIKVNDFENTIIIQGLNSDSKLINIVKDYYNVVPLNKKGLTISKSLSDSLNIKVGDVVLLNDKEVEVVYISEECSYQINYMDYDLLCDYSINKNSNDSIVLTVKDQQKFLDAYSFNESFTTINSKYEMEEEYKSRLNAFDVSSQIVIVISIIMGIIIVYNMIKTNLREQKRSLATLRTLGYSINSIKLSNLIITLIEYLISSIIGLIIGTIYSKVLLMNISTSRQTYVYPNSLFVYALTFGIVLLFVLVSHILNMLEIKKWNLPSETKERE